MTKHPAVFLATCVWRFRCRLRRAAPLLISAFVVGPIVGFIAGTVINWLTEGP